MSLSATLRRPARGAICAAAVAAIATTVLAFPGRAQAVTISMRALSSFGGGDGWLSPAEAGGTLNVSNQVRSMAFDPSTSTLLIPSGANTVQRINATSGTYQGATFTNTGVTGGSVLINTVAATSDGVIYASNLTTNSTTSVFKVYRWTADNVAPTVSYSGNGGLAGTRIGDDIAILGADSGGILGFGYASGAAGNGFGIISTGTAGSATGVGFATGLNPAVGAFRLGMAFVTGSSVIGTQNSSLLPYATFSGTSATLVSNPTLPNGGSQRGVGYGSAYGTPLLATIDSVSNIVRLYDATNLAAPTQLSALTLTTSTAGNGNGTAQVLFGSLSGQPVLYALNSNNGIQAFQIVPEPSTTLAAGVCTVGLAGMMLRGRRRSQDA
jgi:hypothetical protein